jgi:hypothetical protein
LDDDASERATGVVEDEPSTAPGLASPPVVAVVAAGVLELEQPTPPARKKAKPTTGNVILLDSRSMEAPEGEAMCCRAREIRRRVRRTCYGR